MDNCKRFVAMCHAAGIPQRPKQHLLLHMPVRSLTEGSPSWHATWQDETLNRNLAAIGSVAHRRVWELRLLANFEQLMQAQSKRKRGNCT